MQVTVSSPQRISVSINQGNPQTVRQTSTFFGSADVQPQIIAISETANTALIEANTANAEVQGAYTLANTKLSLTGGTITGDLDITGNVIANNVILDGGIF